MMQGDDICFTGKMSLVDYANPLFKTVAFVLGQP